MSILLRILVALVLSVVALAGFLSLTFGVTALIVLVDAFVLTKLWEWFVVTGFELSPLTIPYAIGLGLIATILTSHPSFNSVAEEKFSWEKFFTNVFYRPFALLTTGYVVHRWFM